MLRKTSQTTPIQAEVVNTYSTSQENAYSCDYINKIIKTTTVTGTTNSNGELYLNDYPIANYNLISAYITNFCVSIATNGDGTLYAVTVLQRGTHSLMTNTQVTINITYIER